MTSRKHCSPTEEPTCCHILHLMFASYWKPKVKNHYLPLQCDGMVARFNRTIKSMIRTHTALFGQQWDCCLPGLLYMYMYVYRNTFHKSTWEKLSWLLFGEDCRSPSEAVLLPPSTLQSADVNNHREEVILSLPSALELAAKCIQKAQSKYKQHYHYDHIAVPTTPTRSGNRYLSSILMKKQKTEEMILTLAWTIPDPGSKWTWCD